MKILQINDTYGELGGTEKYLLDLCAELERRGHQIVILSSTENKHISVRGRKEYFVKPSFGLRSGLRRWNFYRDIIQKENPDLIHIHNTQHNDEYFFLSPLILKRLNQLKPTVRFVHDTRLFCPNGGQKIIPSSNTLCHYPVGKYCLNKRGCHLFAFHRGDVSYPLRKFLLVKYELSVSKRISRIIVTSQYMHDELIKNKIPEEKINLLPLYTEKGMILENTENKSTGLILYIGRFVEGKGIVPLIETLSSLKDKPWKTEIVGEEGGKEVFHEIQMKVERLGLKDRITFLGKLSNEEIDQCYQRCQLVIIPSMFPESFCLVGIEAMAFGKPVVAFDSGGIRDWLVDGDTGYLVERGNVKELATKVSQLLENEPFAREMGAKGREKVNQLYRKHLHMERLISIYEEVIHERRGKEQGLAG